MIKGKKQEGTKDKKTSLREKKEMINVTVSVSDYPFHERQITQFSF